MAAPRALRDLVSDAARAIGRAPSDVAPFVKILAENWFDSAESLASCKAEELTALGIPLRFAQQLVAVAGSAGKPSAAPVAWPALREPRRPPAPKAAAGPLERSVSRMRVLRVKDFDPNFRARGSILGTKGRNVHHIQDQTGVKVDLRGDSDEPMEMVFSDAPSSTSLEHAVKMGKDLLQSVYGQYREWQLEGRPARSGGEGGGPAAAEGRGRREGGMGEGKGGSKGTRGKDTPADAEFQHTVEISECDPGFGLRGKLLGGKGRNVREIEEKTGAAVQLKGESGEPMRLELGAASPEALAQAQELAEELVANVYALYDGWLQQGGKGEEARAEGGGGGGGKGSVRDAPSRGQKRRQAGGKGGPAAVMQTLELQECDARFTVRGKVLGAGGRNLKHIEDETGAKLELIGKDDEPLQLKIGGDDADVVESAVKAAEDLLSAVYDEYARWLEEEAAGGGAEGGEGGGGAKGKGKVSRPSDANGGKRKGAGGKAGGGKGLGEFRKILKLKECDPGFDLRNALRGNKCENLHHIQDETRARLWCLGEAGDPVRLEISAHSEEVFEQAVQMAKDLIKTVFREYDRWLNSKEQREAPVKRQRAS